MSQIVLHRSGCDPDFSATKRFQIDVQPLIDTLVEKSRADEERRLVEMTQKLEEAIARKQEAEAKLQHAENVIKELEKGTGRSGSSLPVSEYTDIYCKCSSCIGHIFLLRGNWIYNLTKRIPHRVYTKFIIYFIVCTTTLINRKQFLLFSLTISVRYIKYFLKKHLTIPQKL